MGNNLEIIAFNNLEFRIINLLRILSLSEPEALIPKQTET